MIKLRPHQLEATEYFLEKGYIDPFIIEQHGAVVGGNIQEVFNTLQTDRGRLIILSDSQSDICPDPQKCPFFGLFECDSARSIMYENRIAKKRGWVLGVVQPMNGVR